MVDDEPRLRAGTLLILFSSITLAYFGIRQVFFVVNVRANVTSSKVVYSHIYVII